MGHVDDQDLIPLRPAFDVVRRGYDRAQVDDRFEELQADLHIVMADNQAAAAQAAELARQLEATQQELYDVRRELQLLSGPPDTVEGLSPRLQRMVRLAKDEAAEITARAEAAAVERMAQAEKDAGGVRGRYEQMISGMHRRQSEMEAEHRGVIAQAQQRGEDTMTQARQRAAELDAEATAKRQQVEEDFDITMCARRSEAARAFADEEARSKSEAERRIAEADRRIAEAERRLAEATEVARRVVTEADQRATAMVGDATRRVEALRTVRHQVAEQLLSMRSTLDNAVRQLAPLPDEDRTLAAEGHRPHAGTSPQRPG
ncbi:MAG: chromosome segregation protein [Pseudonocardiales bacterium]